MEHAKIGQLSICGIEPIPQSVKRSRRAQSTTRGDYYGIRANLLAKDATAKLGKLRAKIEKLQEPWAEADSMIEAATATALRAVDELIKQYQDSAEYMNETMDT